MLKHTPITTRRIDQFIRHDLATWIITGTAPLETDFCQGDHKTEQDVRKKGQWSPIEPGFSWGPAYTEGWYRAKGHVPHEWAGRSVALVYGEAKVDFSRDHMVEGTVWRDNQPVAGLDHGHVFVRLDDEAKGGEGVDLCLQAFAHNSETTVTLPEKPRTPKPEVFAGFSLISIDEPILALYYDCQFAYHLLKSLEETDPSHATLLRALNDVCNTVEKDNARAIGRCRKLLRDALSDLGGEPNHVITAVGHAHLDTAWLWPLDVTKLKMVHTTAVQLELAQRYPEHVFVHSQASQYEWLEKDYPGLFERVKGAVEAGQWEPVGSMWVEADCNLTGAEALVRQFLYGRRYFKQKLGVTTEDMWLPDVFGYSAALPQILSKFGIKYFLTQKMSWNQFNPIPHHTFWWKGIDGSRVWTHFPPSDTYCGMCEPKEILDSVKKYRDHGRCNRSLYPIGFGDGGGGTTEWHLESLRRARIATNMPIIEEGATALSFFRDAKAESKDLMTWSGELYFELHRGTYTSQAANKKSNRECEFLLRDAEWLSCFRSDFPRKYPHAELEEAWKTVLLNQFHDIIPGSSVREVYVESAEQYDVVRKNGELLIKDALKSIAGGLDTANMQHPVALFQNSTVPTEGSIAWERDNVPSCLVVAGEARPVQLVEGLGERKLVFETPQECLGAVVAGDLSDAAPISKPRLKAAARRLENSELAVKFDANGNITSIQTLDDNPIEFVEPGKPANVFQLFEDKPLSWDAWDIDIYALETGKDLLKCESFEIVERGPVRAAVEVVRRFGKSTIRQRISLGPTPGIRFDTQIDWHEDRKLLKVAFPLNVNATTAKYEIQFGHVDRPTHQNTSWDVARFEVCAQKWVDVSEGGHGAALLNDGKYGHDVTSNLLRLTLLRSPKAPDPTCDMGVHRFSYVLLPHFDQVQHSDVVAAAYALNAPLRWAMLEPKSGAKGELPRLMDCDDRSIVIESVKKAEDSDKIVVRMYECHNSRGQAELLCALPVKNAWLTDLNETPLEELEVRDGAVRFDYKPFEIVTVMVEV